jgi:hypothetical protein
MAASAFVFVVPIDGMDGWMDEGGIDRWVLSGEEEGPGKGKIPTG